LVKFIFFLFTASIVSSGWFLNRLFCAEVPFMINLKTPGTIYDKYENPRYHLWYIWKPEVKTRGTISCQVFVSKCYFVTKFVTEHVAKHATCFVSKLFCVVDTIYDTFENPRYYLWYIWKPHVLFMVHLKTPCKNPRYHFVSSVCFKMLLCYKICYKTCCKTCNMFCKQIILCQ
jgi:hypothetical protein